MKKTLSTIILFSFCFFVIAQDGPSSFYKTNPTLGKRVSTPIVIDGNPSEWTDDMLIVQGVANDDPRAFRGAHEGPVYDLYQLYAAWDNNNLYLMWQITNVSDIASPTQDYPHSDNGKPWNGNMPFQIALDISPDTGTDGMFAGKTEVGVKDSHIWDVFNVFSNKNVDRLLMFSSKPGVGEPAVFRINENTGSFDYNNLTGFAQAGIEYQWGDYCFAKEIWGIPQDEHIDYGFVDQFNFLPEHLEDESLYVDFLTYKCPTTGKTHDPSQETIYEMKIPLSAIGIDADYLESEGIGIMLVSTFGQSGTSSLPFDATTLDNATVAYGPDESTSKEKEDVDYFTANFARIAKDGGEVIPRPTVNVSPTGGTYIGGTEVTLTASGENEPIKIYYTLDGATPTASSSSVNSGEKISITSNCTLKAIAIDADGVSSFVKTNQYVTEIVIPEGGITVSFKVPDDWGTDGVHIWAWHTENLFASWPGVLMTEGENGWYYYAFDESITSVNVIFSKNNGGYQSVDIEGITESTCYEIANPSGKFTVQTIDCPTYTSIFDSELSQFISVYPNPAADVIYLSLQENNAENVDLFTIDGTLIKSIKNYQSNDAINISDIPTGLYIISIKGKNGEMKKSKFIKR